MFCKKYVHNKTFTKFTGKHLCQSPQLKENPTCFPVNFVKVLRATFFYRTHPAVASEKLVSCKPNLIWQLLWHIQRKEIWQFPLLKHTAMLLSISYYQYFADLSMTWKSSKRAYDGVKIATIVDFHLLL